MYILYISVFIYKSSITFFHHYKTKSNNRLTYLQKHVFFSELHPFNVSVFFRDTAQLFTQAATCVHASLPQTPKCSPCTRVTIATLPPPRTPSPPKPSKHRTQPAHAAFVNERAAGSEKRLQSVSVCVCVCVGEISIHESCTLNCPLCSPQSPRKSFTIHVRECASAQTCDSKRLAGARVCVCMCVCPAHLHARVCECVRMINVERNCGD